MADKKKGALTPGDYTKNIGNEKNKMKRLFNERQASFLDSKSNRYVDLYPKREERMVKRNEEPKTTMHKISSVEAQFDKAFKNPSNGARRNKK